MLCPQRESDDGFHKNRCKSYLYTDRDMARFQVEGSRWPARDGRRQADSPTHSMSIGVFGVFVVMFGQLQLATRRAMVPSLCCLSRTPVSSLARFGHGENFPPAPAANPFILHRGAPSLTCPGPPTQASNPPSQPTNLITNNKSIALVGLTFLAGLTLLPALLIGCFLQRFLSSAATGRPARLFTRNFAASGSPLLPFVPRFRCLPVCSLLQHRGKSLFSRPGRPGTLKAQNGSQGPPSRPGSQEASQVGERSQKGSQATRPLQPHQPDFHLQAAGHRCVDPVAVHILWLCFYGWGSKPPCHHHEPLEAAPILHPDLQLLRPRPSHQCGRFLGLKKLVKLHG